MVQKNQLYLLYDEGCPLCNWYTKAFVKHDFISNETRLPYSQAVLENKLQFNHELAKNKIALVNAENNETLYGIDSLLYILGTKMPWIQKIGQWEPIHFLLVQIYSFISFNRKAIAPVHVCETNCSCDPSVSYFWRIIYILFATSIIHFSVGYYFFQFLNAHLVENPVPDFILFGSQFVFQFASFRLLKQRDFYTYAGHLTTVSLIGALLLIGIGLVLTLLQNLGINIGLLAPLGFGVVLTAMFLIHYTRIKKLGFSGYLTLSWIIFRISIYALVFKLF